jgi:diguanylate cyclase (GGDEF)-like protein
MLDIDHFKSFNDTYGHAQGDVVLKHFAQRIRDCVRTDLDIPARYGGEEFVVLLPDTDAEGGRLAAERIRKTVESFAFPYEKGPLHVTTSVGVATFPDHAVDGSELLKKADTALYRCKEGAQSCRVYDPDGGGGGMSRPAPTIRRRSARSFPPAPRRRLLPPRRKPIPAPRAS